jgi:rhodanese-related sulfurtransferase
MATRIDLQRLQELLANDAQLIEVLPPAEYTKEQLPGAISLPSRSATTTPGQRAGSKLIANNCLVFTWPTPPPAHRHH